MRSQTAILNLVCSLGSFLALSAIDMAYGQSPVDEKARLIAPDATAISQAVRDALGLQAFSLVELDLPTEHRAAFDFQIEIDGAEFTVHMEPHSVRAPGFRVLVDRGNGMLDEVPAPAPKTYRGSIEGMPGSAVVGSLTDAGLSAMLLFDDEEPPQRWMVEPLTKAIAGAPASRHVLFRSEDALPAEGQCAEAMPGRDLPSAPDTDGSAPRGGSDLWVAEIAYDIDYAFYASQFSDLAFTVGVVEAIHNSMNVIYERDCNVTFVITAIVVRLAAGQDPYSGITNSIELLGVLRDFWNQNGDEIQRDLVHLMTGQFLDGGFIVIGRSYPDSICTDSAYSLSRTLWNAFLDARAAVLAHEIGHNFDAQHCDGQSCCNIMCSQIGGCGGYGLPNFCPNASFIIKQTASLSRCLDSPFSPLPPGPHLFFSEFDGHGSRAFVSPYPPAEPIDFVSSEGNPPGQWVGVMFGPGGGTNPTVSASGGVMTLQGGQGGSADKLNIVHCLDNVGEDWTLQMRFFPGAFVSDRHQLILSTRTASGVGLPPRFTCNLGMGELTLNGLAVPLPILTTFAHRLLIINTSGGASATVFDDITGQELASVTGAPSGGCLNRITLESENYTAEARAFDWIVIDGPTGSCQCAGECLPTAPGVDCNSNGCDDGWDITSGSSQDCDSSGVPDECELTAVTNWVGPDGGMFDDPINWDTGCVPTFEAILQDTTGLDSRAIVSLLYPPFDLMTVGATGAGNQIVQIDATGSLEVTQTAQIQTGGVIDLQGGTLDGVVDVQSGGTIFGQGLVQADVSNDGRIEANVAFQTLSLGGTLTNTTNAVLAASNSATLQVVPPDQTVNFLVEATGGSTILFSGILTNDGRIELDQSELNAGDQLTNNTELRLNGSPATVTTTGAVVNNGEICVASGIGQFFGSALQNNPGANINIAPGVFAFVNGSLLVPGGGVNWGASCSFVRGGAGTPAVLTVLGDLQADAPASLLAADGTLQLAGNFDVAIDNGNHFGFSTAKIQLIGAAQEIEVLAPDRGPNAVLLDPSLLSIGTLEVVSPTATVTLVDNHGDTGNEVLYVGALVLAPGMTLNLAGQKLYYATASPMDLIGVTIVDSVGCGGLFPIAPQIKGDMNCDGVLDFSDVSPFILALTSPGDFCVTYPDCNMINGDMSDDTLVDGQDIQLFVDGLLIP